MIKILKTTSQNPDFQHLVKLLDQDLAVRDGEEHAFYHQFNKIDSLKHCIVLFIEGKPVSCGAVKAIESDKMEIKRMYTLPEYRGQKLASLVLHHLERWASELGYTACVLETGKKQPEAIRLYEKNKYTRTPNYGQYVGVENSVCFIKML